MNLSNPYHTHNKNIKKQTKTHSHSDLIFDHPTIPKTHHITIPGLAIGLLLEYFAIIYLHVFTHAGLGVLY